MTLLGNRTIKFLHDGIPANVFPIISFHTVFENSFIHWFKDFINFLFCLLNKYLLFLFNTLNNFR